MRLWSNGTKAVVRWAPDTVAAYVGDALTYWYAGGAADAVWARETTDAPEPNRPTFRDGSEIAALAEDASRVAWIGNAWTRAVLLDGPDGSRVATISQIGRVMEQVRLPGRWVAGPLGGLVVVEVGGELWMVGVKTHPTLAIERGFVFEPNGLEALVRHGDGWLVHRGDRVERLVGSSARVERWYIPPDAETYEEWVDSAGFRAAPIDTTVAPGRFVVQTRVRAPGTDLAGVYIDVPQRAGVRFDRGRFDDTGSEVDDGVLAFPHASLSRGRPALLTLEGTVMNPTTLRLPVSTREFEPIDPDSKRPPKDTVRSVEVGAIEVRFAIEAPTIELVRGAQRLALDGAWTRTLAELGVLDVEAEAPDLSRWMRRALARCRVQAFEDDPDAVLAEWKRMTERDRAANKGKLPAYKLTEGRYWIVTDDEARAIRSALGADHPMSRFATGAFEVVGPEPLASVSC